MNASKPKGLYLALLSLFLLGAICAAAAIFTTPLKNIALVDPTVRDIKSATFFELFNKNPDHYVFIDVRPESVYNSLHARGAKNIPLQMMYSEHNFLPKIGKEIVLICSRGSASGVAYSYLEHFGFQNLWRIEGGIEAWEAAGLPVESTKI